MMWPLSEYSVSMLLLLSAVAVVAYPIRALAIMLLLAAAAASPIGMATLSSNDLKQRASSAATQIVRPIVVDALPPALAASIADKRMATSIVNLLISLYDELRDGEQAREFVSDVLDNKQIHHFLSQALLAAVTTVETDARVRAAATEVIKFAIKDALNDDDMRTTIQDTLKNTLKRGGLYSSAAKGVAGALNPFKPPTRLERECTKELVTIDCTTVSPAKSA